MSCMACCLTFLSIIQYPITSTHSELRRICELHTIRVTTMWTKMGKWNTFFNIKVEFLWDKFVVFSTRFTCVDSFHYPLITWVKILYIIREIIGFHRFFSERSWERILPTVSEFCSFIFTKRVPLHSERFVVPMRAERWMKKSSPLISFFHMLDNLSLHDQVFFRRILLIENTVFSFP